MSWADKSLKEFQDALASDAPTPGGGSAVGVAQVKRPLYRSWFVNSHYRMKNTKMDGQFLSELKK